MRGCQDARVTSSDAGTVLAQYPRVAGPAGDRATVTFVLTIEANATRGQALLLCESIRAFAGMYRDAPILAVSARAGHSIDAGARRDLASLFVDYHDLPLNSRCPEYGPANRVYAGAWAESWVPTDWLILLDSDTLLLDEPYVPQESDAGVRPLDAKGIASAGIGDPLEEYWTRLAALAGTSLERLPFIDATIDGSRVRASYDGGLLVVRRSTGILQAAAGLLTAAFDAGLKPQAGTRSNMFASTGYLGAAGTEYWGSSQAAAALAAWSRTSRVHVYPDSYDVPLHAVAQQSPIDARWTAASPVHVHYHWMFTPSYTSAAIQALERLGTGRDRLEWLRTRVPLGV
jgi:hypothetical protein